MGTPSQSYGTSLAIWDHTVLPVTRHKWTCPTYPAAMEAGTRFTYPGGMEVWVDLVDLIAPWPGVEPVTFRSRVRRRTAAPPRQPWLNNFHASGFWSLTFDILDGVALLLSRWHCGNPWGFSRQLRPWLNSNIPTSWPATQDRRTPEETRRTRRQNGSQCLWTYGQRWTIYSRQPQGRFCVVKVEIRYTSFPAAIVGNKLTTSPSTGKLRGNITPKIHYTRFPVTLPTCYGLATGKLV